MSFKTRVAVSFGLFVLLVAVLGGGLVVNSYREEQAFHQGRNALRAQFMAQEIEYFIDKKIKAVEAYVMLNEELESLVIEEADAVLDKKFDVWDRWVKAGDGSGMDLAQTRNIDGELRAVEARVRDLMERGNKAGAMQVVGGNYRDLATKARKKVREIATRKVQETVESERTMQRVVRQSHMTSIAGVLLAIVLGLVLAMSLYNSVMLPMKVLFMWSEQIARGHLHVSLNIPGGGEMGRLAENFNGMIQNLSQRHSDQVERQRTILEEEKTRERERSQEELQEALRKRKEAEEIEDTSTLEDAVEGFREILDIMGAPPHHREKKR